MVDTAQTKAKKIITFANLLQNKKQNKDKKDLKLEVKDIIYYYYNYYSYKKSNCQDLYPEKRLNKKQNSKEKEFSRDSREDKSIPYYLFIGYIGKLSNTGLKVLYINRSNKDLYLDLGTTNYIILNPKLFIKGSLKPHYYNIETAGGDIVIALGIGKIQIWLWRKKKRSIEIIFQNILYLPEGNINLILKDRLEKITKAYIIRQNRTIRLIDRDMVISYYNKIDYIQILKIICGPDKLDSGYISYTFYASNLGGDPTK